MKRACPICSGCGIIVTELVFMDPVTTVCETCGGSRCSNKALSYSCHGKNIADILEMSADEAVEFFAGCPKMRKWLEAIGRFCKAQQHGHCN